MFKPKTKTSKCPKSLAVNDRAKHCLHVAVAMRSTWHIQCHLGGQRELGIIQVPNEVFPQGHDTKHLRPKEQQAAVSRVVSQTDSATKRRCSVWVCTPWITLALFFRTFSWLCCFSLPWQSARTWQTIVSQRSTYWTPDEKVVLFSTPLMSDPAKGPGWRCICTSPEQALLCKNGLSTCWTRPKPFSNQGSHLHQKCPPRPFPLGTSRQSTIANTHKYMLCTATCT